MKDSNPTQEITVPELAQSLECSIPRAQTLIRTGRIPGHKTPRGWVTTRQAIDKYLAERARGSASPRRSSSR
ncbi:MAG: helix-turn-helix domain-containing protein [Acidobacteriota bacterium]